MVTKLSNEIAKIISHHENHFCIYFLDFKSLLCFFNMYFKHHYNELKYYSPLDELYLVSDVNNIFSFKFPIRNKI